MIIVNNTVANICREDIVNYSLNLKGNVNLKIGTPFGVLNGKYLKTFTDEVKSFIIPKEIIEILPYAFYEYNINYIFMKNGLIVIGDNAFSKSDIKNIVIPSTVNNFGKKVFYQCEHLQAVSFLCNLEIIPEKTFIFCENLIKVSFCFSPLIIEDYVFSNCNHLTEVNDLNKVMHIGKFAFSHCTNIETLIFNQNSLKHIGEFAFLQCNSLKNLAGLENVTYIGRGAFSSCSMIETFTIPNLVTSLYGSTFSYCENLRHIGNTKNLISIGDYEFYNCPLLTEIELSDQIDIIPTGAFSECCGLSKFIIPPKTTKIATYAFKKCININELVFPISVTEVEAYALLDCYGLKKLIIENENISISNLLFGQNATSVEYSLEEIVIPKNSPKNLMNQIKELLYTANLTHNVIIKDTEGNILFTFSKEIRSLEETKKLKKESDDKFATALKTFNDLISIDEKGSLDKEKLNNKLTIMYLGYYNFFTTLSLKNNTKIIPDNAFAIFEGYLKSIILNDGLQHIGEYAFLNCKEITRICMPNSVDFLGRGAFENCIMLNHVRLSNGIKVLPELIFSRCENLENLDLPYGLEVVAQQALFESGVKSLFLPSSIKILEYAALYGAQKLKKVTFAPNNNMLTISDMCFTGTAVEILELPENVRCIGTPFTCMNELRELTFRGIFEILNDIDVSIFYEDEKLKFINVSSHATVESLNQLFIELDKGKCFEKVIVRVIGMSDNLRGMSEAEIEQYLCNLKIQDSKNITNITDGGTVKKL